MQKLILLFAAVVMSVCPVAATEVPTTELGKKLFHSEDLGSNNKSCASCHPDGKGLEEIDAYDNGMLKEMINFCIRDALDGEMIDPDSTELESMRLYLRSL